MLLSPLPEKAFSPIEVIDDGKTRFSSAVHFMKAAGLMVLMPLPISTLTSLEHESKQE